MIDIAVVGATGVVGEAILNLLAERHFPIGKLYLLASERSVGKTLTCGKRSVKVENVDDFDFSRVRMALFTAGSTVSRQYVPLAIESGSVVIDNSSCFRCDEEVPLIVPEVNICDISGYERRGIIACPDSLTTQLVAALKPIYDAAGIDRIEVVSYQSVSGFGRSGVDELASQTARLLNGLPIEAEVLPAQIAFNVISHVDELRVGGYTGQEMQIVRETRRIFDDPEMNINPTCALVPVFYGHCQAVHIETVEPITAVRARDLLEVAPGIEVVDDLGANRYPMPVGDSMRGDSVLVGRIREAISCERGLNLWIVSDNVRKAAALNSIKLAEHLIEFWF